MKNDVVVALLSALLFASPAALSAEEMLPNYSGWKHDARGHFTSREYRYRPYSGAATRKQLYIYFNPRSQFYGHLARADRGGYMFNPRTKKIWGVVSPDGTQYSVLAKPVSWNALPDLDPATFPAFGPFPNIPPEAPGEPLGPVLTPPPDEIMPASWRTNPPRCDGGTCHQ